MQPKGPLIIQEILPCIESSKADPSATEKIGTNEPSNLELSMFQSILLKVTIFSTHRDLSTIFEFIFILIGILTTLAQKRNLSQIQNNIQVELIQRKSIPKAAAQY